MRVDLRPLRLERGGTLVVNVRETMATGLDDLAFLVPVEGTLTLRNLGSTVHVGGALSTAVDLTCDRCARTFRYDLRTVLDEDLDWAGADDGFLAVQGDAVTLDVDAMAREALVLELPMVCRCDPECKGLCDQCGADLRIEPCRCAQPAADADERPADPRLSTLASWRSSGDAGRR